MKLQHAVIENVDEVVAKARAASMLLMRESEERFIESVTARARDAMTTEQAISIVIEQREVVLDQIDEAMNRLRAWILRGGRDTH